MGVVVVGDTAAICGGIWLGVVVFVVAIFGSGIWGGAAFWVGNCGVGFGRCSAVAAVEKFKFR